MNKYLVLSVYFVISFLGISNFAEAGLDFEVQLPISTITVDGSPEDWAEISPYFTDNQGDSTQGEGTDIKSLYLCQDNNYLYWRIDT